MKLVDNLNDVAIVARHLHPGAFDEDQPWSQEVSHARCAARVAAQAAIKMRGPWSKRVIAMYRSQVEADPQIQATRKAKRILSRSALGRVPLKQRLLKVMQNAAEREGGSLCPTGAVSADAEQSILKELEAEGMLEWKDGSPLLSKAGRIVVERLPWSRAEQKADF